MAGPPRPASAVAHLAPRSPHPALTESERSAGRWSPTYLAYRAAAAVARGLPAPLAQTAARFGGLLLALARPGQRRLVARHLVRVHGGDVSTPQLRREVLGAFLSYSRYWAESFRLPGMTPEELDRGMLHEGVSHIEDAVAAGTGAILALPHLGAWDYAGAWLGQCRGFPITAVVEPIEPPELFEWFADLRRSLSMTIVPLGPASASAVLAALRANQVVALLCDRDLAGGGVEVELFGERTTLPPGPIALALRSGAPVLPTAVYYEGHRRRSVVGPPLSLARRGTFREDVARLTQDLAHELELLIRRAPEQWHLFQPNWPSER